MSRKSARQFATALQHPAQVQEQILLRTIRRNANTEFGAAHGMASIKSVREYQQRVPIRTYDEFEPWIDRVAAGERNVLTREPVRRMIPTSGSSAARKLIPWTKSLQQEFNRAIGPWIVDLFQRDPELMRSPAYWSISVPDVDEARARRTNAVPVGFDDDSDYLGGLLKPLIEGTMAVPNLVRHIHDPDSFRYATLLFLLRRRELRLISVWHPSFLAILLDALRDHWHDLLADVERGSFSPPGAIDGKIHRSIVNRMRSKPGRARELRHVDPADVAAIWPRLRLISCWADARAADAAADLRRRVPNQQVAIQPKGLLATEAFVTLPYADHHPLAVYSHFFEFVGEDGRVLLAHELPSKCGTDDTFTVIITTAGGLYRYNLGDRVCVTGRIGNTPSLRFIGRDNRCSDYCGEKLTDAFVERVISQALHGVAGVRFAMLAPDRQHDKLAYTLYIESPPEAVPIGIADRLETLLAENPHYALARRLGQLAPARLYRIESAAHQCYLHAPHHAGRRIGDLKPASLDPRDGWTEVFDGQYARALA